MNSSEINKTTIADIPPGRLGIWFLIIGELVIFGGIMVCYLLYRIRLPEWGEQAKHTSTLMGAINTVILLTSSYSIVMAHSFANKKEIGKTVNWMLFTIILGICFLVIKSIEYSNEINHGYTLLGAESLSGVNSTGSLFWSFYYFMTGLHATHVLAGLIIIFINLLDVRKGINLHRVELSGLYWHMVDLIWIFLFPLLYIAS